MKAPLDLAAALHEGLTLHGAGRIDEAKAIYAKILAADPKHFEALSYAGLVAFQQGDHAEAVRRLEQALAVNDTVAAIFNAHGGALAALQQYAEALKSFDRALALDPANADAISNRGGVLAMLGRHGEAIAAFDRALALGPQDAELHYNRGRACGALQRYQDALADFDRALALAPNHPTVNYDRALVLSACGRLREAAASFERAIILIPDNPQSHLDLALTRKAIGEFDRALASLDRAIALKPDYVAAYTNRGSIYLDMQRYDDAIASVDRALEIDPACAAAHYNRALALEGLGRFDEAIESYGKAMAHDPAMPYAAGRHAFARMQICSWHGLDAEIQSVLHQIDVGRLAAPPFPLFAMPASPAQQQQAAVLYCDAILPPVRPPLKPARKPAGEKIRIGYFSADFHNHATAYLMAGLFEAHDRTRFEIIGISFGRPMIDAMGVRLRAAFDRVLDVAAKSDEEIAALARELRIDIAVDLKGHSFESRPGIFAYRAAPIQVNFLVHPGTMGTPVMDYLIADPVLIPPEHRAFYTEKIAYLPPSYQVNDSKRAATDRIFTRRELDLPETSFVFCAFNNSFKIDRAVFDVWMRLLKKVDDSVLWLLEGPGKAGGNLRREAEQRGVAADRLVFAKRLPPDAHLARHRAADLFLDTFHYNAHTTASDALWAGLPVVTKLGDTFAGRVAASVLTAAGLPELITRDVQSYENLAYDLAVHPNKLTALKQRLAAHKTTCALFDTVRFARNLEAGYRTMLEIYDRGDAPEHFQIDEAD